MDAHVHLYWLCVIAGCDEQSEETSTGHWRGWWPSHSVSQGHSHTHTHSLTHTHTHSHTHSLTHTHSHTHLHTLG